MRFSGTIAIAAAALMSTGLAHAQTGSPSAQQIIQALKPSGNISSTTRGIVPLSQSNSAAAKPAPSVAKPAAVDMGKAPAPQATPKPAMTPAAKPPSINLNIEFAMGSARLTPTAVTELNQLGKALTDKSLSGYRFSVVGHTDTTGSAATNLALSKARAKAVKAYLTTKFAIPASRLSATGVGESDLLVPTGPNVANQANRRVQVINTGK